MHRHSPMLFARSGQEHQSPGASQQTARDAPPSPPSRSSEVEMRSQYCHLNSLPVAELRAIFSLLTLCAAPWLALWLGQEPLPRCLNHTASKDANRADGYHHWLPSALRAAVARTWRAARPTRDGFAGLVQSLKPRTVKQIVGRHSRMKMVDSGRLIACEYSDEIAVDLDCLGVSHGCWFRALACRDL